MIFFFVSRIYMEIDEKKNCSLRTRIGTTRERVSMHLATASSSKSAVDSLSHPLETVELSLLLTNVNYNVYARVCDEQKQSIFDNSAFTVGAGFPWTRRRRKAERRADFW